ncbi:SulP family inorganic anion transporter [Psychrobacter sanguinis]|uniref:SulP family inorganic anion transporter n=1 Tax=Psychrobacter sanguinis TaxID=861445 RepID=UPI00020C97D8|nr:SulP family inorganic anion transporter [Psychrobacter sanguinis]EGK13631.1 SulP family sulfate permease [Psychrobacter sp. 1501(2011)]MCC3308854.1 SulP family inorganic anion transporter [Psychrobacter sanguinis]MCD9150442.1 SulP family inorganic anion transporter [Psychrobacter sanguinis]UEC26146.1 SulP family inorganic anion transporter [Psychrobacter sanguinis]
MIVPSLNTIQDEWFSNVRGDVLSGLVVALALIPEAIAFSIIAGVDPKVGLYASFCIAVVISFVGGRPGMISAATGAMALVMVTLVADHGLQYLLAATLLCGVIQFVMGVFKLGNLMRFVSRSVVIGFVNALAILIFMAQLPELNPATERVTISVYIMTAAGLAIIYGFPHFPKIGKIIPSPLICIVGLTAVALYMGIDIRNVGDMGELPDTLPMFLLPNIPLTLDTLLIIAPYSLALAVVGLLESMMTATIVDDLTDTPSDKNRECRGQGVANVVSGFFGGMAGCAMIGQSVINVKSGGRTRLSTLIAGVVLLIMVVFLSDWVSQIPMAALVAVMIMVSIGTFNWESIREFKTHPMSFNVVMLATVITTVFTHNLAYGVLVGVLLSSLFFANKIGQFLSVVSELDDDNNTRYYYVQGQVFFSSTTQFLNSFDTKEALDKVVIDVSQAHFWDVTAVDTLDKLVIRFQREGSDVKVVGLNSASRTIIDKFSIHDRHDIGLID